MKIRELKNFLNGLDEKVLDYEIYLDNIFKAEYESWESILIDSDILEITNETIQRYGGLYIVVDKSELGKNDVCIVPENYEIKEGN